MTIIDDTAHRGARLVADLTAAGIKVPKPVAAAAATRDTLATATRAVPRADVLAAELVDALTADPGGDHTELAVRVQAAPALLDAHRSALDRAGRNLSAAVEQHSDEICRQVGAVIVEPAIPTLEQAATVTVAGDTPGSLTNVQRHDDARLLLEAGLAADRLVLANRLRTGLYRRTRISSNPWAIWRHPELRPDFTDGTPPVDRYLAGIRAGAALWWPTWTEADAAQRQAEAEARRVAQAEAPAHTRRSSVVGTR